ncbi:MAG: TAXI family TRAP transporter solute-binding subunit [Magnetococcales bacterium]|nr:TAXI family TRAP transporter solute-binding subunit [Magnetococcales bacterium]
MTKKLMIIVTVLLLTMKNSWGDGWYQSDIITIKTGGKYGTYFQLGSDMKRLAGLHGISLNVSASDGSLENLNAVVNNDEVHLAIIQSDVIEWLAERMVKSRKSGGLLRKLKVKTRFIFPLHEEEIHILSRSDIHSLKELQGKKVAVGQLRSGTFLTAGRLFKSANIKITPVRADGKEALIQLEHGEVDAIMAIGGLPIKLFEDKVNKLLTRKGANSFHLLSINHNSALPQYHKTTIPANTYKWQKSAVSTVSVLATLVTFDFDRENANCQRIKQFSDLINNNIDWLRNNGHEKWQNVDLETPLPPMFLRSDCLQ